ncbi:ABC transporter substrate-binding protein [Acinetobacter puyangensis]|uniref:ABC-type nitrate/sulfonate/bicarbonate transport system, substrate-binding protein n=1 Tax=Acinetobacter puyangensis TaxID=1096779 RepID=A0A240E7B6_9GAMM|nr:ABC transporter substrate-binding protein [Acinetobacter puyangensis]SNX44466.1 ABC-type nitrate/sulfonate/bicarbonate transport system, substrate-binding protein [Acinetobacter puyangensis]
MHIRKVAPHVWIAVLLLGLSTFLVGCQQSNESTKGKITELRYQGTPGAVGLPELAEDLGYLGELKLNYVGSTQGGPENMQALMSKDVDYASAFNGAIVKLAHATRNSPNSIVAVVGSYGSDQHTWTCYCVLEDSPIRSARDLIGKKIAGNTLGAHFEFIIREWLAQQGLTQNEIKQVQLVVLPPVSTEQALRQGQIHAASMSTILRDKAFARGGVRKLFADTDLYGEFTAGTYVFTRQFTQQHPEVVKQFVSGVGRALEWSRNNPPEVVRERLTQIIRKRGRNENDQLIQYWNSYGVIETGGYVTAQQFQPWIDFMVKNGELKANDITPEDIFSNEFNSFAPQQVQASGATETAAYSQSTEHVEVKP